MLLKNVEIGLVVRVKRGRYAGFIGKIEEPFFFDAAPTHVWLGAVTKGGLNRPDRLRCHIANVEPVRL